MAALLSRLSLQPALRQPYLLRCVSASPALLRFKRPTLDQPLPPKKPANAFAIFVQDVIREEPRPLARCGSLWKELDNDKKKQYQHLFEQRKKEYAKSLEEFYTTLDVSKEEYLKGLKKYKQKMKKFRQKKSQEKLGILKPRKRTPMNVFMSRTLSGITKEELPVKFADAAHMWRLLPESEKEVYKHEAESATKKLMAEYNHRKAELQKVLPEFKEPEKKAQKRSKAAKPSKKVTVKAKGTTVKRKKRVVDDGEDD